jgi:predicted dehydrogenase
MWFEDFEIGREMVTVGRTIGEHDVYTFAGLTGDAYELHTNEEYGRTTIFGSRIVHGMLGLSIMHGLICRTLHVEGTMTAPNGLFLKPDSWRVDPRQSPAGGMAGLGIHMVDSMIDVVGPIREVTCQSLHRAVPTGAQDTTSILLAFENGATGYVSCMTATAPSYRFCVYGSKGIAEIRGQGLDQFSFAPVPDAPLSGHATPKPVETAHVAGFDTVAAELAAFAAAVRGEAAFPISPEQMIHGAAVFEAVAASAASRVRVSVK